MDKYLDFRQETDFKKLNEPAKIIKNGGIVVFPTETVYGIGTNGLNEQAVEKLYKVKKRPKNKPISLLVSDIKMINQIAKDITELEYKLIETFFPGPLTIILKKKDCVPNIVTSNGDTVGIRMPQGEIARKLIEYAGIPIATPSANITGKPSGIELKNIIKDFDEKVDYYIDGGKCDIGISSTIVKVIDGVPKILRQGSITKEEIDRVCVTQTRNQ